MDVNLSGASADLVAALAGFTTYTGDVTFTDSPSLAQFSAVDSATSGALSYTSISDSLSALVTDAGLTTGAVAYNKPITVTDTGTVLAADLHTVSANTNQTLTATAATTISGSATELLSVVNDTGIGTATNYIATVTGTSAVSEISAIDNDTTGTVSVANVSDTPSAIQTYNGASATNAAILQNATGTITANGDLNPDTADFSAVLKGMTINGFAGQDALTGTNFADLITGGADADSLLGKGDADTFYYALGDAPTGFVAGGTYEKINDFSAAQDKIDLVTAPQLGTAESKAATIGGLAGTVAIDAAGKVTFTGDGLADLTLVEALAAVRSVVNGVGEVGFFQMNPGSGDSTFLYQENGASANDLLIALFGTTGVTTTSGTAGGVSTLLIV